MKQFILLFAIIFLFSIQALATESRSIYGTISDESGAKIPGVNVLVENSKRGTVSDVNGYYSIPVLPEDKYLVFRFIGMKTKRVKIGKKNIVDVKLKMDIVLMADQVQMEEVVTVGYATRHKSAKLPGAVSGRYVSNYSSMAPPSPIWNTENYSTIHESGFKNALRNPLSTFSIDVDNAAYSNVRRYLNQGIIPPKDAVRIEEMINYFNYNYPEPEDDHPFSVTTELAKCPWNSENYLMHVGLKGKSIDKSELPASNLVFLLDVSGSMDAPNKLPLLKRAFKMLVNELRPNDRVAIVVYAGAAGKVLGSTPGNKKMKILQALETLSAGGSTAGGAGLKLAYKIAEKHFIEDGNNRIILATDGDFNVGISSTSEMERLVEQKRENGIFITVLGFGTGNIKDDKMETIADKGNGNYSYIDNIQEARKTLISEFGGTLFTIAKDVKFQLEFNPKHVKSYRLLGYENRLLNDEDFNDDKKDAGEMGAGHTVTALYEIVPVHSNQNSPDIDPLKYQESKLTGKNSKDLLSIKLRYKQPDEGKSKLLEMPVRNTLKNKTSDNFRFSAAVASFGMYLRESEFMGDTSPESIIELASNAKGTDKEGYRSEFIQLVKLLDKLQPTAGNQER